MDTWDDPWLIAAMESALVNEPGLEGSHIDVQARGGVVTLTGTVRSVAQRERAAYVARNFGGVLDLHNDLQVTP